MSDTITEVWTSPKGTACELVPFDADPECSWFPEGPGQRPPQGYRFVHAPTGTVVAEKVVFPLAPWSAYDAVSDLAVAAGWTSPAEPDFQVCEHGLSADLCVGPSHYPLDDR